MPRYHTPIPSSFRPTHHTARRPCNAMPEENKPARISRFARTRAYTPIEFMTSPLAPTATDPIDALTPGLETLGRGAIAIPITCRESTYNVPPYNISKLVPKFISEANQHIEVCSTFGKVDELTKVGTFWLML